MLVLESIKKSLYIQPFKGEFVMKKIEAQQLAIDRSKLIIEYILQILSDSEKVNATMDFFDDKIENQNRIILNINVPQRNFKRSLNLEITSDHENILFAQLLDDLLKTFLPHETMGITKYYSMKTMHSNFTGIDAINTLGSRIAINFNSSGTEFMKLIENYQAKYNAFIENRNTTIFESNGSLKI